MGHLHECWEYDMHQCYGHDFITNLTTELWNKNALPFACDTEYDQIHSADTVPEIREAYRSIMVHRVGIPPWFAVGMNLAQMVFAWECVMEELVCPETGIPIRRIFEWDGYHQEHDSITVHEMEDESLGERWDSVVSFSAPHPLMVAKLEDAKLYCLHGGTLPTPDQMKMFGNPPRYHNGSPFTAFYNEQSPMLLKMKVLALLETQEWDLFYTIRDNESPY